MPHQSELTLTDGAVAAPAAEPAAGPRANLHVHGRLRGIPKARLAVLAARAGSDLVGSPAQAVRIVLAAGSAGRVLDGGGLPRRFPPAALLESEAGFKRRLGLRPPLPDLPRLLGAAEIMRAGRIEEADLRWLVLYDVLEPVEDRFSYADLLAAREVSRLMAEGFRLSQIVEAAQALAAAGRRLSDTRLAEAPWGEILQQYRGSLGRLDGQFKLPLPLETVPSTEETFARAEACEAERDYAEAERWYRIAAKLDRLDPVIPFNLGNVLDEQGRRHEAILAYHEALSRDPMFPEAWYNLGLLADRAHQPDRAIRYYREALAVWPKYNDALFALGRLFTDRARFREAAEIWEAAVKLKLSDKESALAMRYAALCTLELALASAAPPPVGSDALPGDAARRA